MIDEKPVLISNHGRITIPAEFRKKMKLKDGQKVIFIEDEGSLRIIPILTTENLRKRSINAKEMEQVYNESQQEELELENK
ncbi:MAG: AbrB/MazE/SpoVT family DNA-binding domain-containing protein [Candidatus Hodarchaeales archaeon]|jgi:AbrB family looped-hinge helix DNA binding protein